MNDKELEALIISLATVRGDKGFSDDDARIVISWAEDTRQAANLLELVLAKEVLVNVQNGEVEFSLPSVQGDK